MLERFQGSIRSSAYLREAEDAALLREPFARRRGLAPVQRLPSLHLRNEGTLAAGEVLRRARWY